MQEHKQPQPGQEKQRLLNYLPFLFGQEGVAQSLWSEDGLTFYMALDHVRYNRRYKHLAQQKLWEDLLGPQIPARET